MVLVAVYSIDSILEELVKVFQSQMVLVSQLAKTLVMEQAEQAMELIRVWTTLSLDSNLNLEVNLILEETKEELVLCHNSQFQLQATHL